MILSSYPHQYVERNSLQVVTEKPIGDRCIQLLYNTMRESSPALFRALTSARMSSILSFWHYDLASKTRRNAGELFTRVGADSQECVQPLSYYDSYRKVFERQIRYWETRPMNRRESTVVSPADARVLIGSLEEKSPLFIKDKFFDLEELLGTKTDYYMRFCDGDFAVFRLTPDKYHYNHVPVNGRVVEVYHVEGQYHSCNPSALISVASLYSKNRRVVTIIDTDVEGGSQIGLVAMIEIVALMIGEVVQTYSEDRYTNPTNVIEGMWLKRGCPKSLYRPGSSTDVLLFEPDRIHFCEDLVTNSKRFDVKSRFSAGFGKPLVETDILVRSPLAEPRMQII